MTTGISNLNFRSLEIDYEIQVFKYSCIFLKSSKHELEIVKCHINGRKVNILFILAIPSPQYITSQVSNYCT